jgi:hypothetical protein
MIVQVVFGSVLIVLGLCALIGLPSLSMHLQRRDARANAFEKIEQALAGDVQKIESAIERVYQDEIAQRQTVRDAATESDVVYH